MKDCSYVSDSHSPSNCELTSSKKSQEERRPSFSVYESEAIEAIFGNTALFAGEEYDISPMRVRIKRVTSDEKEGISNVELSVVAVGTIKPVKASERQSYGDEATDEEKD